MYGNTVAACFDNLGRLDISYYAKEELKGHGYENTIDVLNASEFDLLFKTDLTNDDIRDIKYSLERSGFGGLRG